MTTLYVLLVLMTCSGDCPPPPPEALVVYETRAQCAKAAEKIEGQVDVGGMVYDGPGDDPNGLTIRAHPQYTRTWHAVCKRLEVKP